MTKHGTATSITPISARFNEAAVDAVFADLDRTDLAGAAAGVSIDGEPVYRKAFGLANMELRELLSTSMRMRVASVTKHLICFAYLLLCEEGLASPDDRIGSFIPGLHPVSRNVSMRQLMSHTSGLRDAHDLVYHFSGFQQRATVEEIVELYRQIDSVNFQPGEGWSYNNGAYVLLSLAIEKVAGEPLEDVLRERVFEPVGMHDSLLRRFDADFIPNSATLHMIKAGGGYEKSYVEKEHLGEGGVATTVDDMLRWLAHMDEPVVGSSQTWKAMRSPVLLESGQSTGYAMGLNLARYRGLDTISHSGLLWGCTAHMVKIPAAGLDVVVIANRHDVSSTMLAYQIVDTMVEGLEPTPSLGGGRARLGRFRSPTSGKVIELLEKDGRPHLALNGAVVEVAPDRDGVLRPLPAGRYASEGVRVVSGAGGVVRLEHEDHGRSDEFLLLEDAAILDPGAISGLYSYTPAGITLDIGRGEACTAGPFGRSKYDLTRLSDRLWIARSTGVMPWSGVLDFADDCSSLCFSTGRTWKLEFARER